MRSGIGLTGRFEPSSTSDSIDGFIEARLNANGLLPESAAPKHVLVRRLYFDLTGLPPSAEEIASFVNDDSPTAYERLVDRLLGSSAYGEHLARRWMDVARYAESITLRGFVLADAWRYRDYVIEAYNQDRPFDQMIRDQIAGDLIEHSDLEQQKLSCVATGFLALANTNLEDQDKKKLEFDHIDEQLTTIGRAFLGQTIGCARCHDHKFDPIPTKDYYALAAIFRSTVAFKHSNLSMWIRRPLPLEPEVAAEYAGFQRELDELKPRLSQVSNELKELERAKKAEKENETENTQDAETEVLVAEKKNLEKQQRKLEALIAKRPMYISISEGKPVESLEVRIRGNTHQTGQPVRRGFLSAFGASAEFAGRIPDDQSGRLELANWIADDRHPLTARVYANRVWSWMMGEGIVGTENNFGTTGVEPTDPALLDWLAGELIRSGWSTKHLVRTVVCSDAYRRTSDSDRHLAVDAENELLWRANRKRLPIESIRDAMASLGGDLDHAMLGSEIRANTKSDYEYDHRSKRKSVYWPVFRNSPPPLYTVFDFANSSVSVGERSESTIPTQALAIANHPWVMRQAKQAAKRFGAKDFERVDQLIGNLFESCLGRQPTAAERSTARDFLGPYDSAEPRDEEKLATLIHSLFASIDFRYLD